MPDDHEVEVGHQGQHASALAGAVIEHDRAGLGYRHRAAGDDPAAGIQLGGGERRGVGGQHDGRGVFGQVCEPVRRQASRYDEAARQLSSARAASTRAIAPGSAVLRPARRQRGSRRRARRTERRCRGPPDRGVRAGTREAARRTRRPHPHRRPSRRRWRLGSGPGRAPWARSLRATVFGAERCVSEPVSASPSVNARPADADGGTGSVLGPGQKSDAATGGAGARSCAARGCVRRRGRVAERAGRHRRGRRARAAGPPGAEGFGRHGRRLPGAGPAAPQRQPPGPGCRGPGRIQQPAAGHRRPLREGQPAPDPAASTRRRRTPAVRDRKGPAGAQSTAWARRCTSASGMLIATGQTS